MRLGTRHGGGRVLLSALVAAGLLLSPKPTLAVDQAQYQEQGSTSPIQRRKYELGHELSLGWAYLPLDAYYKGYGLQVAYTIHFSDLVALELFRVGWSYNIDTKLKNKLIDQMPDISPGEFPAVVLWEHTNLLLKLFYGKQSFLNGTVLHFELFATAGGAFVFRNPYPIWDGDQSNAHYEFGVNGGFGFRFWLNPDWSVRVDMRDTVILFTLNQSKLRAKNSAMIGLTFAVNL